MSRADDHYAKAEREIEQARETGAETLDLVALHGLTHLPPSITSLKRLKILVLAGTQVVDITLLAQLPALFVLDISRTPFTDLSRLAALPALTVLSLLRTPVTDFTPLATLPALVTLNLCETGGTDITPLAAIRSLVTLVLARTGIKDLSALAALPALASLDLSYTKVTDLSPLAASTLIHKLDLEYTPIQRDSFRALSRLQRLVTDPGPSLAHSTYRGLHFKGTEAAKSDPRIAEIAEIEYPSTRARALFEYLGLPVDGPANPAQPDADPPPPDVPAQSLTALRYSVSASGALTYDPTLAPSTLSDQQRQLHGFLFEDCADLAQLFGMGHEAPFAFVAQKLDRYAAGLGPSADAISPAVVWKVGNDLRQILESDGGRQPGDFTNRPFFNTDQRSGLKGLVATHNVFVSLIPDLAKLDEVATDPARRHRAEQDAALIAAALDAMSEQVRLIMADVVSDLRDLSTEADGDTLASLRADRLTQESLENLIKAIVAEAIAQERGSSTLSALSGDTRAALVGAAVGTVWPEVAATYPQLVAALQPHFAALLAAWHGKDYPVSRAVEWVMARIRTGR